MLGILRITLACRAIKIEQQGRSVLTARNGKDWRLILYETR